jgi:hypothetical protein
MQVQVPHDDLLLWRQCYVLLPLNADQLAGKVQQAQQQQHGHLRGAVLVPVVRPPASRKVVVPPLVRLLVPIVLPPALRYTVVPWLSRVAVPTVRPLLSRMTVWFCASAGVAASASNIAIVNFILVTLLERLISIGCSTLWTGACAGFALLKVGK